MSNITNTSAMSQPEKEHNYQPNTAHKAKSQPIQTAKKAVCSNWKTTAIGVILSCTGFIAFSPNNFGGDNALLVQLSRYITSGGLAALGVYSKDFNVSGGDRQE